MKKFIVVISEDTKPDFLKLPAGEGGAAMAMQIKWKPLYNDLEDESAEEAFTADPDHKLSQIKEKMRRTFTVEIDENNEATLEKMKEQGLIENYKEDEINEAYWQPNDPLFNTLYALQKINVGTAWQSGYKGQGILVAVIDSGIDEKHPDLKGNLWTDGLLHYGYNVINDSFDLTDQSHHGTHVAGTIGAIANNNTGIAGVAPECRILAIKALDGFPRSTGEASNLAKAIRKAADKGARVINNSWGPGRHSQIELAIEYATLKGAVCVFAAGNDNAQVTNNDAAGNPLVISVASTDQKDQKANTSNFGKLVSVSAPGVGINSTVPGSNYKLNSGTSMAAPHVSGLAAILLSKKPNLVPATIKNVIVNNTAPFTTQPSQPIGSGRIDVSKAINAV